MTKIIIDCDKQPKIPYKGWTIEEHKKGGKLIWEPKNIELYLDSKQINGRIEGNDLRKNLKGKPVLNACILDYLLEHLSLVPEEWKGKLVYFWGTIFSDADGSLFVEYLCWLGGRWRRYYSWLDDVWYGHEPAALLSSINRNSGSRKLDSTLGSFDPLDFESRISVLEKKWERLEKALKIKP